MPEIIKVSFSSFNIFFKFSKLCVCIVLLLFTLINNSDIIVGRLIICIFLIFKFEILLISIFFIFFFYL
jgi:hypothetical protein